MLKNVLIISWFGANTKQLDKFTKLYERIGFKSQVFKTPILKSISYNEWNKWKKNGLPEDLKNINYDRIHIFSGGVFVYHNWLLHDKIYNKNTLNHSSIVFDSSPFFPLDYQVSNYVVDQVPYLKSSNNLIKNSVDRFWKFQKYNQNEKFDEFVNNINCGRKKTLIYSKNDILLDHNLISKQIELWKYNSTEVITSDVFNDSGHLKHYKIHPDEYTEMLLK